MALDDFFERMQREVRQEVRRKAEAERLERKANEELERRMRQALKPFSDAGLSFEAVVAQTGVPGSAYQLYEQMLQETADKRSRDEAERQKALDDAFLAGFNQS